MESKKLKIYFWEKWALKPEDERDDKISFYEVDDDPTIREVIRDLESRIIGKKLLFSDVHPAIPSVKEWIDDIREDYPERNDKDVKALLDTFRGFLYPRSKERYRLIVGILLLNDVLLVVHCKKDPSLAELKNKIYPVKVILHPKNVLRAAIIRNEDGKTTFSAFEYSKKWSKGHADFWGIEPEDISWESLGSISLTVELNSFPYLIQLPIEPEQLDEMVKNNRISPTGKIRIGREEGKITKAGIFKRYMDFTEFYEFYITEKEKLEDHRKKFKELIPNKPTIFDSDRNLKNKYKYKEDVEKVFEFAPEGDKPVHDKTHPRYTICFFTKYYPKIKPSEKLIFQLYQSIFENNRLEIWHAAEETSTEPVTIGSLDIYNKIEITHEFEELSNNLLNIIQDAISRKTRILLQSYFCDLWKKNVGDGAIKDMFEFITDAIILPELEFEFKNEGMLDTEECLEFKSADVIVRSFSEVDAKPTRFVKNALIPTIRTYIENGKTTRFCILYGIEDNGLIRPLYNLKSDQITRIKEITNEELLNDKIQITARSIPFKDGVILSVFIIPVTMTVEGKQ